MTTQNERLRALVESRPGVPEWSHVSNCWVYQGARYEDPHVADHRWSIDLARYADKLENELEAILAEDKGTGQGEPTVDEIAEAMADAGLWKGAWVGMCDPEKDVIRQRAEGVYALLQRRAVPPSTGEPETTTLGQQRSGQHRDPSQRR